MNLLEVMSRDEFESVELDAVYQWLAHTLSREIFYSLRDTPGRLRSVWHGVTRKPVHTVTDCAGVRPTSHFTATTAVDFAPVSFQQLAGLICYYNSCKFHYLYISTDDEIGKHIGIMSCEADKSSAVTFPQFKTIEFRFLMAR